MIESIRLRSDYIEIVDQTLLPAQTVYLSLASWQQMTDAIKRLAIRGAPALGVAAAGGCWLAALQYKGQASWRSLLQSAIDDLAKSRPTAVNLFMALNKCKAIVADAVDDQQVVEQLFAYASSLQQHELNACQGMAKNGLELLGNRASLNILTICNTGSLATYGQGTALAVIKELAKHCQVTVYACETRPLLQGARLTMWELAQSGINAYLIPDGAAAWTIKTKGIDFVITGADRIAQNGDSANKIGTYALALAAFVHEVPFYIAAPFTTVDTTCPNGSNIVIEQRPADEVRSFGTCQTAPANCQVFNPAFDVTPASLISAIITDTGTYQHPYSFKGE